MNATDHLCHCRLTDFKYAQGFNLFHIPGSNKIKLNFLNKIRGK